MFGRIVCQATVFSLAIAGLASADGQQTSVPPQHSPGATAPADGRQALSPLHAFLGIDPITGEFKRPGGSARSGESRPNEAPAVGPTGSFSNENSNGSDSTGGGSPLSEATLDDFRAAIAKAVDEHDDDALAAAFTNLTRSTGYEGFSLVSPQIERLGYLALFLYPLGIVISEFYGGWSRRNTPRRTERERCYWGRHVRRRLVLAALSVTTISVFWWAGENRFWWNDPQRLMAVLAALALLMALSALLRLIISRAAKDYPFRVIEDLRMQQFALENEIKELRRRLSGDGLTDAV
ncbi:MAG TPA: hypothetical protein VFG04_05140 [Planctomycetaceae bacterium]|jgi:hypothetical protein|nr:hypothetical protein [Planctomycetaceae bacterium]